MTLKQVRHSKKMVKEKNLSVQQKEKGLISLIEDSKILKFSKDLILKYSNQLKVIQQELKRDREKLLKFNRVRKGGMKNDRNM